MSEKTPGQVAYETFQAARWPDDPGTAWTHPAVATARGPWEAVAQAVAAHVATADHDHAAEITRLRDELTGAREHLGWIWRETTDENARQRADQALTALSQAGVE